MFEKKNNLIQEGLDSFQYLIGDFAHYKVSE